MDTSVISSRTEALQTAVVTALEAQRVTVEINLVKNAHAFQTFQAAKEYFGRAFIFTHFFWSYLVYRYNQKRELFVDHYHAFIFGEILNSISFIITEKCFCFNM